MNNNICLVGFAEGGNFSKQVSQMSNIVDSVKTLKELYYLYGTNSTMANRLVLHGKLLEDSIMESCSELKTFYQDTLKRKGMTVVVLSNIKLASRTINKLFIDTDSVVCRYFTQLTPMNINEILNENIQVLVERYKQVDFGEEDLADNKDTELSVSEILDFGSSHKPDSEEQVTVEESALDKPADPASWRDIPDEFSFDSEDGSSVDESDETWESIPDDLEGIVSELEGEIEEDVGGTSVDRTEDDITNDDSEIDAMDIVLDTQDGADESEEIGDTQEIDEVNTFDGTGEFPHTENDEVSHPDGVHGDSGTSTNEDIVDDKSDVSNDKSKKSNRKSSPQSFVGSLKKGVEKVKDRLESIESELGTENIPDVTLNSTSKRQGGKSKGKRGHEGKRVEPTRDRYGRKVILLTGHSGAGVSYVSSLLAMGYNILNSESTLLVDLDFLYSTMAYDFEISTREELYGNVVEAIGNDRGISLIDDFIIKLPSGLHVLTFNPSSMPSDGHISEYIFKALKRSSYNVIIFDAPIYVLDKLPESFLFTANPLFAIQATGAGALKGLYNIENMEFEGATSFVSNLGFVENNGEHDFNMGDFLDTVVSNIDYESIPVLGSIPSIQWEYSAASFVKLRKGKHLTGIEELIKNI